MKRLLIRLRNALGTIVLVIIAFGVIGAMFSWLLEPGVPDEVILEVDLEKDFVDFKPSNPFAAAMLRDSGSLIQTVNALERASRDERVVGLIANIGASGMGMATVQELRDAITAFREAGKKAIAYSETFGEVAPGNNVYYLATAFDEIYMQPSGDLGLTGVLIENRFFRGTVEKLGLDPRIDHRYEYKTAKNLFTEREYTAAHREAQQALLDSWFKQMVGDIARSRGLTEGQVRGVIDRGPFYGVEATEAGLIDGLAYRDEVYDRLEDEFGEDTELLFLGKYRQRAGGPYDDGETIALIYGVGGVARGSSSYDPLNGFVMGSDSVTAAFRAAIDDDDVKAIVFRVNSPGGSYVASDAIWRETVRAREAGKPVVVTMGDLAGSGGYFVAMDADQIIAHPGTITASIGVVGGKFLSSGFWDKLGISWDHVASSANATIWTGLEDYSEQEWERFQAWLDRVYVDFTSKVADGRNLPEEQVLEIAKGRIWSGEDGKALGLVDHLGGFTKAVAVAKEAAGIAPDEPVELRLYPRPKRPIQHLLEQGPDNSRETSTVDLAVKLLQVMQPAARLMQQLGLIEQPPAVLMTPEFETEAR